MKKFHPILLFAIFLSGCSGLSPVLNLIASPTPIIPTDTPTPQPTVTLIPTIDFFATITPTPVTFTPTKTSLAPIATDTNTPLPIPTLKPPSTSQGLSFFTPKNPGFVSILTSHYVLYWNSGPCSPRTVTMTAFVEDTISTDRVVLFMRLREKSDTTLLGEWSAAEMIPETGSFTYDIAAINLRKYIWFREAWLEYQLISYDKDNVELARTQIFDKNLSLVMCRDLSSP